MGINTAYLLPLGIIKAVEILCSLISLGLLAETVEKWVNMSDETTYEPERVRILLAMVAVSSVFLLICFFINIFDLGMKFKCCSASTAVFMVALVHFIIGVATIAASSWIIDAFVYGDEIYGDEIGIGRDIFGFSLTRDTNGEWKPLSFDKPKTAMAFGMITGILLVIDAGVHGYVGRNELKELNTTYLFPLGIFKGVEFVCSLISSAMLAEAAVTSNYYDRKHIHERLTFSLTMGVISCVFTVVWFSINLLNVGKSIKCGSKFTAHLMIALLHFIIGGTILAAGAWFVVMFASDEYPEWGFGFFEMYHDANINEKPLASGAFGIVTGIILVIDAGVHLCVGRKD